MGGATCPRKERPARPFMLIKEGMNKYAEQIKVIKGIWMGPLTITTRLHEWVVKAIQEPAANEEQAIANVAEPQTFSAAVPANAPIPSVTAPQDFDNTTPANDSAPWTCVNNCNAQGCANPVGTGMCRNGKRHDPSPQTFNEAITRAVNEVNDPNEGWQHNDQAYLGAMPPPIPHCF